MFKILHAAAFVGLFSAAPAMAAKIDLSALTYNGSASSISKNELQLTADTGSQAGSAFLASAISTATPFTASFVYSEASAQAPADGFAFLLQSVGANAVGQGGGYLAAGIGQSVGVALHTYNYDYVNIFTSGYVFSGTQNPITAPAGTVSDPGNFDFTVKYNGSSLSFTATNLETMSTVTGSQLVDLSSLGSTAFVGFTGATGGQSSDQRISDFKFTSGVAAVPEFGTWFMMILGFGVIGGVMRCAYRKSEQSFTEKVRSLANV